MTQDRIATRSHTPESGGTLKQPYAAVAVLEYALCVNGKPCARPRVNGEPSDRPPPRIDEEPCARLRVVDGEPGVRPRVGDLGGWRSIDGSRRSLILSKSFWVHV
uniref:Uncharacterized protein n=1 Tax=Oryza glaberrima TaxID=4538 RepID=I1PEB7_ORYGL